MKVLWEMRIDFGFSIKLVQIESGEYQLRQFIDGNTVARFPIDEQSMTQLYEGIKTTRTRSDECEYHDHECPGIRECTCERF